MRLTAESWVKMNVQTERHRGEIAADTLQQMTVKDGQRHSSKLPQIQCDHYQFRPHVLLQRTSPILQKFLSSRKKKGAKEARILRISDPERTHAENMHSGPRTEVIKIELRVHGSKVSRAHLLQQLARKSQGPIRANTASQTCGHLKLYRSFNFEQHPDANSIDTGPLSYRHSRN